MSDNAFGGFFIGQTEEGQPSDTEATISVPEVVPQPQPAPAPAPQAAPAPGPASAPAAAPAFTVPAVTEEPAVVPVAAPAASTAKPQPSREQRLGLALHRLMEESADVEAAALVSLDGFTMASALPKGMQEDRVGAMSAAILGLGERAATELGRGHLTQVFIEGEDGYVVLIAAGDRAVLTCLAGKQAKLGLVLYDMREAADEVAEILG